MWINSGITLSKLRQLEMFLELCFEPRDPVGIVSRKHEVVYIKNQNQNLVTVADDVEIPIRFRFEKSLFLEIRINFGVPGSWGLFQALEGFT
jgi:uncharacterized protein YciU (UPF0263 family)